MPSVNQTPDVLRVTFVEINEEGKVTKRFPRIDAEGQLKNTVLHKRYPEILVAVVSVPTLQLDAYEEAKVRDALMRQRIDGVEYRLVGASGSAKDGKFYAVDADHERPIAERFQKWPQAAITYFGILVSDCRVVIDEPDTRVLVVEDHALGTNDCRGWISERLFGKLNLPDHRFCQFRLVFDRTQAKGSFKVMQDATERDRLRAAGEQEEQEVDRRKRRRTRPPREPGVGAAHASREYHDLCPRPEWVSLPGKRSSARWMEVAGSRVQYHKSLTRPRTTVGLGSLLFTYLFFFEYLRPFRRVHIPGDLEIFHYPLADYAFQILKQGHFPLWDPSIYCGMSFVGNIQAALFYPPTWLAFATRWNHDRLSYQALENMSLAHVWLAFFLCYLWLRGKRLEELACILGAGVFAFSGYLCAQLHHLGVAAGYAWIPLGLWGIDQAIERRSWWPLWKLAAAAALCFLAGYSPTWFVFIVLTAVYALAGNWRWKATLGVAASVTASLALVAVQLLPTAEVTRLREPELRYAGTREPVLLLAFTLPNYIDFGMNAPAPANPFADYFYLGVPGLLAIPLLIRGRNLRRVAPAGLWASPVW